jgi:glycerol-3-phosphate dehydrogenase
VNRDLARLVTAEFDLLVVGGGIYGLAIAYDAAQRGLGVALIERADFGGATSFNHLKTIHGGLRYLQSGDLKRMRESIRERRAFARIAPRFIRPLAFVMPTTGGLTRNPVAMTAAFTVDAVIGADRNAGLPESHHLPSGRVLSSTEARTLCGDQLPPGRAAIWYDYEIIEGERLTLAFALGAAANGAALANYVEAIGLEKLRQGVVRVRARDVLNNEAFEVRARAVVNAAGPWTTQLPATAGVAGTWPTWRLIKAMNLVTTRPAGSTALVVPTRAGRALILVPWQGRTLVGTSESSGEHQADDQHARKAEVAVFLNEVNSTFPRLNLRADEITLVHRGIVPAATRNGRLSLLGQSPVIDHAADGIDNLVSVIGVKYTTARATAERVVDLVVGKLRRSHITCRTAETTLPTAALQDAPPRDAIRHAVETEMAHTLTDVVVRRSGLGAAGYPGDAAVIQSAAAMQQICGWSDDRLASEMANLRRFYEIE